MIDPQDQSSWRVFLTSFGNLDLAASLSQAFLENLKQNPMSLQQLLSLPPIKDMLLPIIERQWPKISLLLLQWLSHNKSLIVSLINETINETLSSQESLAPLLKKLVGELLGSDEEFSAEFLQKAHAFLLDNLTPEQLYTHLARPLSPWSELKISAIAAKIDPARLKNVLLAVLPDILAQNKAVASLCTTPIAKLLPNWSAIFARINTEVRDKYLNPQTITSIFSKLLWPQLKSFATMPLSEKYPNYLLKIQTLLTDNLLKTAPEQASAIISEYLSEIILENLPAIGEKLTSMPLGKIYGSYFTEQKIQSILPALTARCQELLLSSIPGRLAPLAERSLNSLSNDDMSRLVQDFMGKELKPLNYLGAAMGGTVGTAIGAVSSLTLLDSVNPLFLAAKLGVFGAVGYTTNCGAIKGLFWP